MNNEEIIFSYPNSYKFSSYIVSLVIVVVFIGNIILRLFDAIYLMILGDSQYCQDIVLNLIIILLIPSVATTVINYWQEFKVSSEGIEFQVFLFWRKLIPWNVIIGIKKSYLPWGKYHIVVTKRLTSLHRFIGIIYGFTPQPAFIFNSTIKNYDEAVTTIQKYIELKDS